MSSSLPLLIELGTEELPPKALDELALAFREGVLDGLRRCGITVSDAGARALWSPRRLALHIDHVPLRQPDRIIERRGPAVAAGLDAGGQATKALIGFAASCGVEISALQRVRTDKGEWFVYRTAQAGVSTAERLPSVVADALAALPVPKPMRWGERDVAFVRPVHWLVMLLGDQVVPGAVLGLSSGRLSRGHRFMGDGRPVALVDADSYIDTLRKAFVLVDPAERRARIEQAVSAVAPSGCLPRITPAVLDEVNNLVEWPVAIACRFGAEFLRVPQEALIATMESNQRFFPVLDAQGRLTEHFIGVANVESKQPEEIRRGYERVIRPRFADAAFFFDEDGKSALESHQQALSNVVYRQKLGSVWDKCLRVAELARVIANRVGVDAASATRAAALSKCDLMTRMVGEFPELQGTMGRYYASAQGIEPEVAVAIEQFYQPRFAGDAIAASPLGRVLAIAEKLDTLAGWFVVGEKPSGNKDPYSLRRTALGLARTVIEAGIHLDLAAQIEEALRRVRDDVQRLANQGSEQALVGPTAGVHDPGHLRDPLVAELQDFIFDRLRAYYAEQGHRGDAFDAVLALRPSDLADFDRRLRAVVAFARLPQAHALAAANKRIGNLLRQAEEKGELPPQTLDPAVLALAPEQTLLQALRTQGALADAALRADDYVAALAALADLRPAVDAFFEQVMVMVEQTELRRNRLALLADMRRRFLSIADIGLLQPH